MTCIGGSIEPMKITKDAVEMGAIHEWPDVFGARIVPAAAVGREKWQRLNGQITYGTLSVLLRPKSPLIVTLPID